MQEKPNLKKTPLHWAASGGNKAIVEVLLKHGADVNATDRCYITPLHNAAFYCKLEVAEVLIANGANVNANGCNGTPLFHALSDYDTKQEVIVKLLLQHGAKVNVVQSKDGSTPLHHLESKEIAALFIAHGADINAKDDFNSTPLHDAASRGRKDVVQLLLDAGADKTIKNNKGETPLDFTKRIQYGYGSIKEQQEYNEIITILSNP